MRHDLYGSNKEQNVLKKQFEPDPKREVGQEKRKPSKSMPW